MMFAESVGAGEREFNAAVEQACSRTTPLLLPNQAWNATLVEGQPLMRVYIEDRWWVMRINSGGWSDAQRAAYQRLSSGEGIAGELRIYRRPASDDFVQDRPNSDQLPLSGVVCRTIVWLPREQQREIVRRKAALRPDVRRPDPSIRKQEIQEIALSNLRRAIKANWVTFPSQVPTLRQCDQPDLEHKLVLLYFVMGWTCTSIAARYGLAHQQVRHVLNAWKLRAASAGYIQHIPPMEANLTRRTIQLRSEPSYCMNKRLDHLHSDLLTKRPKSAIKPQGNLHDFLSLSDSDLTDMCCSKLGRSSVDKLRALHTGTVSLGQKCPAESSHN